LAEKKEAQIEIQAVAKIQYPIKSHNNKAKSGPSGFQRRKRWFYAVAVEFCRFFSSSVPEILQKAVVGGRHVIE
jgi:hypothetical protein